MAESASRLVVDDTSGAKRVVDDRLRIECRVPLCGIPPLLAYGTVFFTVMGLAMVVAKFAYQFDRAYGLFDLFDLGSDTSIPTWFSSLGLLTCSGLLAINASVSRRIADHWSTHWRFLAVIFLLLSIDEVARLHEVLGGFIGFQLRPAVGQAGGFLHYSWVISGVAFIAILGVAYIRFLLALSKPIRYRMIASTMIFVGGAVVMEMFNARSAFLAGPHTIRYQVGTVFEEFLEMAGVALFAHVLVLNLSRKLGVFILRLPTGK